jgi:hypothetical protein
VSQTDLADISEADGSSWPRAGARPQARDMPALDEQRARGWPLAALLLSMTVGAKRKPATVDRRRFIDLLRNELVTSRISRLAAAQLKQKCPA